MAYEHILLDKEEGVAIITLNRPEVLNAMNRKLSTELHEAVMAMNTDDEVGQTIVVDISSGQCAAREVKFVDSVDGDVNLAV